MSTLARLLDAAQRRLDPPTVVALHTRLRVSRQTVYDWRNGERAITDEHLAHVLELAHGTPEDAVAVRQETARSELERALWRSVARRLAAAATLAAVASITTLPASIAHAEPVAHVMHYAKKLRRRIAAMLTRRLVGWSHGPAPVLA